VADDGFAAGLDQAGADERAALAEPVVARAVPLFYFMGGVGGWG
jgi:hypothetical protein